MCNLSVDKQKVIELRGCIVLRDAVDRYCNRNRNAFIGHRSHGFSLGTVWFHTAFTVGTKECLCVAYAGYGKHRWFPCEENRPFCMYETWTGHVSVYTIACFVNLITATHVASCSFCNVRIPVGLLIIMFEHPRYEMNSNEKQYLRDAEKWFYTISCLDYSYWSILFVYLDVFIYCLLYFK